MRTKVFSIVLLVGFTVTASDSDESILAQSQHTDSHVALYQTVGITLCGSDKTLKGERSGAVRLEGDDLARAIAFVERSYDGDIDVVLYINAPEPIGERRGQPALLPLKHKDGRYCWPVVVGSYSVPLFLELEGTYQEQIE